MLEVGSEHLIQGLDRLSPRLLSACSHLNLGSAPAELDDDMEGAIAQLVSSVSGVLYVGGGSTRAFVSLGEPAENRFLDVEGRDDDSWNEEFAKLLYDRNVLLELIVPFACSVADASSYPIGPTS